jgi:hypothetical protein
MHQQLWEYKVEWKSVSRGTGGKKVEYHCSRVFRIRLVVNIVLRYRFLAVTSVIRGQHRMK